MMGNDDVQERPAFGAWLIAQQARGGFIGQLAASAARDRSFPKSGDVEAARKWPQLATDPGRSLASLSAPIGRNPAYLQQYISRGSPRRLPEDERRHLAIVLEVDERELGARDPWTPPV